MTQNIAASDSLMAIFGFRRFGFTLEELERMPAEQADAYIRKLYDAAINDNDAYALKELMRLVEAAEKLVKQQNNKIMRGAR